MKFTRRFENPTLVEDRTAGLQSLGGLIQPPPALFRVKASKILTELPDFGLTQILTFFDET